MSIEIVVTIVINVLVIALKVVDFARLRRSLRSWRNASDPFLSQGRRAALKVISESSGNTTLMVSSVTVSAAVSVFGRWIEIHREWTKIVAAHPERTNASRDEILNATVAGLMATRRARTATKAYAALLVTLGLHVLFASLELVQRSDFFLIAGSTLILLLHVNERIFAFRVAKGLYGNNDYEAREILHFILSHADKQDFSDNDGLKKVLPAEQQIELHSILRGKFQGALQ
jgi:hypothetical protein